MWAWWVYQNHLRSYRRQCLRSRNHFRSRNYYRNHRSRHRQSLRHDRRR
nr:MAG TPA: hypothetical protein [Inoviridae sp.]